MTADVVAIGHHVNEPMNMNRQGQSCSSTSRVLVHASLHKNVVTERVSLAEALPIGFPWLKENEAGPIVS